MIQADGAICRNVELLSTHLMAVTLLDGVSEVLLIALDRAGCGRSRWYMAQQHWDATGECASSRVRALQPW